MKTEYDLLPGETVLTEADEVSRYITNTKKEGGELIITNKRLIWITHTFFGKTKEILYFPLKEIAIYDDKASVTVKYDFDVVLTIHFKDGIEKFNFDDDKKLAKNIANQINKFATGLNAELYSAHRTLPGADALADTLKGTVDIFKKTFKKAPERIAVKCSSCGASLVGYKGQTIQCSYCGNMQNI